MSSCPLKSSKHFQALSSLHGEETTQLLYQMNNNELPSLEKSFDMLAGKSGFANLKIFPNLNLASSDIDTYNKNIPQDLLFSSGMDFSDILADIQSFNATILNAYSSPTSNNGFQNNIPTSSLATSVPTNLQDTPVISTESLKNKAYEIAKNIDDKLDQANKELLVIFKEESRSNFVSEANKKRKEELKKEIQNLKSIKNNYQTNFLSKDSKSIIKELEVAISNRFTNPDDYRNLIDKYFQTQFDTIVNGFFANPTPFNLNEAKGVIERLKTLKNIEDPNNILFGDLSSGSLNKIYKNDPELASLLERLTIQIDNFEIKIGEAINQQLKEQVARQSNGALTQDEIDKQIDENLDFDDLNFFDKMFTSIDQTLKSDYIHTQVYMKTIYDHGNRADAEVARLLDKMRKLMDEAGLPNDYDWNNFFVYRNGYKTNEIKTKFNDEFKSKISDWYNIFKNDNNTYLSTDAEINRFAKELLDFVKTNDFELTDYSQIIDYTNSTKDEIKILNNQYTNDLKNKLGKKSYNDLISRIKSQVEMSYDVTTNTFDTDKLIDYNTFYNSNGTLKNSQDLSNSIFTSLNKLNIKSHNIGTYLQIVPNNIKYINQDYESLTSEKLRDTYDFFAEQWDTIRTLIPQEANRVMGSNSVISLDDAINDDLYDKISDEGIKNAFPKLWDRFKNFMLRSFTKKIPYHTKYDQDEFNTIKFTGDVKNINSLVLKEKNYISVLLNLDIKALSNSVSLYDYTKNEEVLKRMLRLTRTKDINELETALKTSYKVEDLSKFKMSSFLNRVAKQEYYNSKNINLPLVTEYYLTSAYAYHAKKTAHYETKSLIANYNDKKISNETAADYDKTNGTRKNAVEKFAEHQRRVLLDQDTNKNWLTTKIKSFNIQTRKELSEKNKQIVDLQNKLNSNNQLTQDEIDYIEDEIIYLSSEMERIKAIGNYNKKTRLKKKELEDLITKLKKDPQNQSLLTQLTKLRLEVKKLEIDDMLKSSSGDLTTFLPQEDKKLLNEYAELVEAVMNNKKLSEDDKSKFLDRMGVIINEMKSNKTRYISAQSFATGLGHLVVNKLLAWNINSALTNKVEGAISNALMCQQEGIFNSMDLYEATNITLNHPEWNKVNILMDRYQVLQENTNELQTAQRNSNSKIKNVLAPHYLTHNMEFANQFPVMVSLLMNTKIKDVNGNTSSVWQALDSQGNLLPEFKTLENQEWEYGDGKNYNQFRFLLGDLISRYHGNYDVKRGMVMKTITIGKLLMSMKTWVPAAIQVRFGDKKVLLSSGKSTMGRYKALSAVGGAFMGGVIGLALASPVILVTGMIGGYFASKMFNNTEYNLTVLEELKLLSMGTVKTLLNQMMYVSSSIPGVLTGGKVGWYNPLDVKSDFTNIGLDEAEQNAMLAALTELTIGLNIIGAGIIVRAVMSALDDDDDDESSLADKSLMITLNKLTSLQDQLTGMLNPQGLYKTLTEGTYVSALQDVYKFFDTMLSTEIDDNYTTGKYSGQSKFIKSFIDAFLPKSFGSAINSDSVLPLFGFGRYTEEDFAKQSTYAKLFRPQLEKDKEEIKQQRSDLKNELKSQGLKDWEIEIELDRQLPSVDQLKQEVISKTLKGGKDKTDEDYLIKKDKKSIDESIKEKIKLGELKLPSHKVDLKKVINDDDKYNSLSKQAKEYMIKKIKEEEVFLNEQAKAYKKKGYKVPMILKGDPKEVTYTE